MPTGALRGDDGNGGLSGAAPVLHPVPDVSVGRALSAAAVIGLLGGLAAGLTCILPPWAGFAAGATIAEGAALLLIVWSVHRALRAVATVSPQLGFGRAIACGVASALSAAAASGACLYVLYRWLRPDLLATRYDGYVAAVAYSRRSPAEVAGELSRLGAVRAQYLDPLAVAAQATALLAFVAVLAAAFLVWRRRTPRRSMPGVPRAR